MIAKQSALDKKLAQLENNLQKQRLTETEHEVMKLKNQIISMTENWAACQLTTIRNKQKEATLMKCRLNMQKQNLQPLLLQQNMDIKNMITQIKNFKTVDLEHQKKETNEKRREPQVIAGRQERERTRQKRSLERAKYNIRRVQTERQAMETQRYNFLEKCNELIKDFQAILDQYKPVKTLITPRKSQ